MVDFPSDVKYIQLIIGVSGHAQEVIHQRSGSFPESCGMLGIKPGSPGNGKSWENQEFKDFFHQDPTTYPRLGLHSPSKRFQGVGFAISSHPTRVQPGVQPGPWAPHPLVLLRIPLAPVGPRLQLGFVAIGNQKVRKQQMRTWLYPPLPDGHIWDPDFCVAPCPSFTSSHSSYLEGIRRPLSVHAVNTTWKQCVAMFHILGRLSYGYIGLTHVAFRTWYPLLACVFLVDCWSLPLHNGTNQGLLLKTAKPWPFLAPTLSIQAFEHLLTGAKRRGWGNGMIVKIA